MAALGKSLVFLGLVIVAIGAVMWAGSAIPVLGRLPGDIYIRRGNLSFYFPLATCILISVVLSLIFMLLRR
jgi:hypothetical protein